ncbi:MAG TPA: tetratricopeptide repeat protein [Trebonia sp.]
MAMSAAGADRMRALAAETGPVMATAPEAGIAELAVHHDELSEAVRWFIAAGDAAAAVGMVADLRPYWSIGGHAALARDLSGAALAMDTAPRVPRYVEAMTWRARFVFSTGGPADEAYASALQAAREAGDAVNQVECLVGLGRVAAREGRWDDLRSLALEALELARATGDGAHQRMPAHMLGGAAQMTGDLDEARQRYQESIEIGNAMGLVSHAAPEYHNLGYVELQSGDVAAAERLFRLSLAEARRYAITFLFPCSVLDFGALAVAHGEFERGAVLAAAAMSFFEESGTVPDPNDNLEYESVTRTLRDHLSADRLAALAKEGQDLTLDAALESLEAEL